MHNQSYSLIDPLEVFAAKSLSLAKTDDKGLGQRPVGKVHIFTSLHGTHGETSVYDTALQGTEICSAQRETSPHLTKKKKKKTEIQACTALEEKRQIYTVLLKGDKSAWGEIGMTQQSNKITEPALPKLHL